MEEFDEDLWIYGVEDINKIYDNVYHSAFHAAESKEKLTELGITHILSMGEEFEEKYKGEYVYKICSVSDDVDKDISQFFLDGIKFMEDAIRYGGTVLVHCAAGISRSGSMMVAYVMKRENMKFEDALNFVKQRRKKVWPNDGFVKQLKAFEEVLFPKQKSKEETKGNFKLNSKSPTKQMEKSTLKPISKPVAKPIAKPTTKQ